MCDLCLAGRRTTKPHEAIGQVSHSLDRTTEKWNHGTIDWRESCASAPRRESSSLPIQIPDHVRGFFKNFGISSVKCTVRSYGCMQNPQWFFMGQRLEGTGSQLYVYISNGLYDDHACTVTIAIRGA